MEAAEENAGEFFQAVDGGEGAEVGGEAGGEVDRGDGRAVKELESGECGEGIEGRDGELDIVGAVGEEEREEVAEGGGVVADDSGMKRSAGVFGGGDVEGLEGSELFRVELGR